MLKLNRDFLRWRWAPFAALSAASLTVTALMIWLIPSQLDAGVQTKAEGAPYRNDQTHAEPASVPEHSSWPPTEAPAPPGQAVTTSVSAELPSGDASALPTDSPFAAQQAATHAREIRRRGRPVLSSSPRWGN